MFWLATNLVLGLSHVTNVLLMEFQIHTMSHLATMSMWTDPSFTVQIQACQLGGGGGGGGGLNPVISMWDMYNFCYKELHTFIKNDINLHMTVNMRPTELELIGSTGDPKNSHTYP